MQFQLIRSATLRLNYGGRWLLVDPYFAPKHNRDPLVGRERNPMIDLPLTPEAILQDIELVIVSHLHFDHFDPIAQERLPKDWPLICQPVDAEKIAEKGFTDVRPLHDTLTWNGIAITRTDGQHGSGQWLERMGSVMGFVLRAEGEPTVYWAGDTIWCEPVEQAIATCRPDVIVTHSSGASFEAGSPIVMDAAQTLQVCQAAPNTTVIAVHLESLDHGTVTRADLRAAAAATGISESRLRIPLDGESVTLSS